MEEQLPAGLGEGKIAEFIEDDEVEPGKVIGNAALPAGTGLGLEPVDRSTTLKKRPRAPLRMGDGNGDRQMRLAGACPADQEDIALMGDEGAGGEIADQALVDRRAGKIEVLDILGQRKLGDGELVLMERACFSDISACNRSPTIFGGSCCRLMATPMISS
ncbi:hypothetical protein ABID19_006957 [Mesorhizobium robiniae]|uniref:Uncharacterized protein n=1 Tax=Mesorhizobium robiniae TaxID=559315 RepID=A0ABV2H028_9HYPH